MTLKTALSQGTKLLEDGGIGVPRLTAEVLLCHALHREKSYLFAHPGDELSEVAWIHYGRYLHERLEGKPTQYITKRQEFYGREFAVSPAVLIPRPETEHLAEAAIALLSPGMRVLDAGTGSGAIAVTLALETQARVFASDISLSALRAAQANACALRADVAFACADLASAFSASSLDMLVSNPPYVPRDEAAALQREVRDHEPHVALFAGPTGNEIYERLAADAARVLRPGGWLLLELGFRSEAAVRDTLGPMWRDVAAAPDLAGIPRVLSARLIR